MSTGLLEKCRGFR